MKYVDGFESLEIALSNMNYIKPFNIFIGVPGDEENYRYLGKSVFSDYAFSILIDPDFYSQYEEEIEKYFYRNADIRKNRILECIKSNGFNDEDSLYISIDKYHYDEDFIRNIINLEDKKSIVLSFFGVKPSDELTFLLKKNKVDVYLYNHDAKFVKVSDRWFTRNDFKKWESDLESYEKISYDKLIHNMDCLGNLFLLNTFSITNISASILYSINIGKSRRVEHKMEINSVYLDNVFYVVKKLREYGYNNPINIECDSLYDINKSLFNYESLGVTFGGSELDIKHINSLFYKYRSIAQEALSNNDLSLSEKLNYIYLILSNIINSEEGKRKELDMLFFKKEIFSHTYDLCRLMGLKPIKCPNTTNFYFFEEHNPNVVKFNPMYVKYIFDMGNIDINNADIENHGWNIVYKSFNEVNKCSNSFEKYLNANSVEEIKEIFIDSVDLSDNLYLNVKDRYVDELNYLINILMDLSEDDYLEFRESTYSFNSVTDVISVCEKVAGMILDNKKKQIGIVMTKVKKLNVSKNRKVRV